MSRFLVIGCGNPLLSDDGAAWHVIESLQDLAEREGVVLKAVHQFAPEQAEDVSQAETVIFVDAAQGEAGRVSVKELDEAPSSAQRFTHSLTPATLLSIARQLYGQAPKKAFLVSIGASCFELSERISEPVARGVVDAGKAVREIISAGN